MTAAAAASNSPAAAAEASPSAAAAAAAAAAPASGASSGSTPPTPSASAATTAAAAAAGAAGGGGGAAAAAGDRDGECLLQLPHLPLSVADLPLLQQHYLGPLELLAFDEDINTVLKCKQLKEHRIKILCDKLKVLPRV